MLHALGSRLSYANVMASGAMFVALGGGAYALSGIPDRGGQFHGCVSNATGLLRVVKSASSCQKPRTIRRHGKRVRLPGELAVIWNQQGPRGLQGDTGPATGPAGGDLSGSYPNPAIAARLKDADAATASLRSLGAGPLQAMPGNATPAPGGPAGGSLTGTYPNPTIANGAITGNQVALHSLTAQAIGGVNELGGSGPVLVNATAGGPQVNTGLVTAGGLLLNSHCTHAANGNITAQVNAVFDFQHTFAATSGAPNGTTNTGTLDPVQVAGLGPTTAAQFGSGSYTVVAQFQPLMTGVIAIGTKLLGHDCVFAAGAVG